MFHTLSFYFSCIITIFRPRPDVYIENIILRKQLEITKRKSPVKRFNFTLKDKLFFVFFNLSFGIKDYLIIFSPTTLLHWQRRLIASFWTFISKDSHPGRPPVPKDVRELILELKNNNIFWGLKRIRDELSKLSIFLCKQTVRNILNDYRRKGKVKKTYSWKKFLKSQNQSILAMDFLTIDTVFNKRFYVLFFISHKTREIIQFALTTHPTKEFVKQQLISLEEIIEESFYLIHDRAPQFILDYESFNIKGICTSVQAPNMNAIAERFVKSLRNEALDHYLLTGFKQVSKIISQYVEYYNYCRPHQGIMSIPKGVPPNRNQESNFSTSNIKKTPILGGLHYHYYRKVA